MLTAKVQYAIILLKEIKDTDNVKTTRLKDVAVKYEINLDLLEQVARLLRIASVIKSVRGPGGGYLAAITLSTLTLNRLIKAVEPTKGLKIAIPNAAGAEIIKYVYSKMLKSLEF